MRIITLDRPGIEPGLDACKASVLAVITISPYNSFDNADCKLRGNTLNTPGGVVLPTRFELVSYA